MTSVKRLDEREWNQIYDWIEADILDGLVGTDRERACKDVRKLLDSLIWQRSYWRGVAKATQAKPALAVVQGASDGGPRRFMSVREIARRVGISMSAVRIEINRGRLAMHRIGRRIVIDERDFDSWLARSRNRNGMTP